jgi:hypothetical protein
MITSPCFFVVTRPVEDTVARVMSDDCQVVFTSALVELSVYVPVAVSCWVSPAGTAAFCGVTAIETIAAGRTVKTVAPVIVPKVALTEVLPVDFVVSRPLASMVATLVAEDTQVKPVSG